MNSQDFIQWFGTLLLVGGAMVISARQTAALRWWPFAVFLVGHVVLVVSSIVTNQWAYVFLNASLAAMDTYAIVIRTLYDRKV